MVLFMRNSNRNDDDYRVMRITFKIEDAGLKMD